MLIGILFTNYGPYHLARLEACHRLFQQLGWEVIGIELAREDNIYDWQTNLTNFPVKIVPIFEERYFNKINKIEIVARITKKLSKLQLDVLAIAGYSNLAMLTALGWAIIHRYPRILFTESKEDDTKRYWWTEAIKSTIIKGFRAALVGGKPHRRYLTRLGMPVERIFFPYDVVGNEDFHSDRIKHLPKLINKPYFLASNRFVAKKNLFVLLFAYATYRQESGDNAWDLVLCGDGELRPQIEMQISNLNLQDCLHLPGFLQQEQLLPYFAHASCFVHASTQEQWGLVVNEAMAAGLPVLVSNCCGCFEDLVIEGVNGFGFSPENPRQLTDLMLKISSGKLDLVAMGNASLQKIENFSPDCFAMGLIQAIKYVSTNS